MPLLGTNVLHSNPFGCSMKVYGTMEMALGQEPLDKCMKFRTANTIPIPTNIPWAKNRLHNVPLIKMTKHNPRILVNNRIKWFRNRIYFVILKQATSLTVHVVGT